MQDILDFAKQKNYKIYLKKKKKLISIEYKVGKENIKNICKDYVIPTSLPDLKAKYGLDYKSIIFILRYCHISIRNMSTSQELITAKKIRTTCMGKYGVDNPSKSELVKEKKRKTFVNHYGVDNISKTKWFKELTHNRWQSYTQKEKKELINKWSKRYGSISKLESYIFECLQELNIDVIGQFKFREYFHKYDFRIQHTKIIIEVYGNYWHANPSKYNENQLVNLPGKNNKKTAKEIWYFDKINNDYAKNKGYKVLILWENEIDKNSKENTKILILDKINEIKE